MKKNRIKVLILEAGGPCGISTIKRIKHHNTAYIVAGDTDAYSPAFSLADEGVVLPLSDTDEFALVVESIIINKQVDIVLPTFEYGHKELSKIGGPSFITDFENTLKCKDKLKFYEESLSLSLPVPKTKTMTEVKRITKPVYIKPRVGVGSRNNFIANTDEEYQRIKSYIQAKDKYLVQDLLKGEHWNVDVLVSNGKFVAAVPRKDLKQKEGNCKTVSVENNTKLIDFAKNVQEKLKITSPFNLEVFENSGKYVINEVNVRFGGGIIFGALAGIDIVNYIVTGDSRFLGKLNEGIYSRYYEEIRC